MTDAKNIANAGTGAVGGGSMLQAFGSLSSGISNKGQLDYQASIAKLNAQIDLQNAEYSRQIGEQQSFQLGTKQSQQMGQIVAAQASSGLDIRSGSNKQVRDSQMMLNQMDTNTIRSNAAKTAYGFEIKAAEADAQADAYSKAGNNSLAAGALGFASSVLGGASSVNSMWLQGQKVGLFNSGSADASTSKGIGSDYVASGGLGV